MMISTDMAEMLERANNRATRIASSVKADKAERSKVAAGWRDILKALGLTGKFFCDRNDFSPYMLTRYMTGARTPSWETIEQINKALAKEGKKK